MAVKTNFEVIPLDEISSKNIAREPKSEKPVVLVVDDEPIIADTLSAILSRNGVAAMPAYNGQTALELARLIPPDLLLTDVVMPDMNGIDLAIAIKAELPDCKILLFSGQGSTVDMLGTARGNGHQFVILAKPIHPKDLLARVSESLRLPTVEYLGNGLKTFPERGGFQSQRSSG